MQNIPSTMAMEDSSRFEKEVLQQKEESRREENELQQRVAEAEKKIEEAQKKLDDAILKVQEGWDEARRLERRSTDYAKDKDVNGIGYRQSALTLWELKLEDIERDNHAKADAQIELIKAQQELQQALEDLEKSERESIASMMKKVTSTPVFQFKLSTGDWKTIGRDLLCGAF